MRPDDDLESYDGDSDATDLFTAKPPAHNGGDEDEMDEMTTAQNDSTSVSPAPTLTMVEEDDTMSPSHGDVSGAAPSPASQTQEITQQTKVRVRKVE